MYKQRKSPTEGRLGVRPSRANGCEFEGSCESYSAFMKIKQVEQKAFTLHKYDY